MNVIYVTGNDHKAKYFSKMVGIEIAHQKADVDEIQSLDAEEIITKKAKQAYELLKKPVIIEDTFLVFDSMGRLPGTFVKWFIDEVGLEAMCNLAIGKNGSSGATAGAAIAYYDGKNMQVFKSSLRGTIAKTLRGESGFGWNRIFIPDGSNSTLGEMSDKDFMLYYDQIKPFKAIRNFLDNLEA